MPGTADRGDPLASLTAFERFAFRLTHRMNRGRWKALWSRCQRAIGARWIGLASSRLLRVHGLEHLDALPADRPLLLVANHRSFFDFYVIASVLLRRLRRPVRLYFPVRGRYFYQSPVGLLINFLIGWWSMFPPLFSSERRRRFDAHALGVLIELLRDPATVVGLHPEGRRNLGPDPYQFLPPQPGVGRLIHQARPAVVPVFVAGLGNDLVRQLAANWLGGE
ncbi:MAG TPA: lysophospholipid acyltransferase family protein, partial [Gemmatimonadales bacterium]|nr:lysophospholipid acyltransferase family protein [Gemmatimonadales bacterium]